MTEPVQKIGGTLGVGQRKGDRNRFPQNSGETAKREVDHEDDQVVISKEARDRIEGRHKKNILEHLDEV